MSKPIHAWFEFASVGGASEHRVILENLPVEFGGPQHTVFWRAPGLPDLTAPPIIDSYVCGLALVAAQADRDFVVHGPMSRLGLFNLGQLLAIRHSLMPKQFPRAAVVEPDSVVDVRRPAGDPGLAVAAVSGGLDSAFTAIRQAYRLCGEASYQLDALVIVHGFDAALDRPDQFAEMRARAEPIADRVGLPLHTVETNVKELRGAAWPQAAIPLTAAALAMFSHRCAFGITSSGAPYATPRLGITHPPVLNAMSSNGWFTVVTDGGSYGRADKIEGLLAFPDVLARLKVCWEGPDPARNCGHCNKCVMTRLNLLAAGVPDPVCFDEPLNLEVLRNLRWRSVIEARDYFNMVWVDLERRGPEGPEADILRRRLSRTMPSPNIRDAAHWLLGRPTVRRLRVRVPKRRRAVELRRAARN